MLRQTVDSRDIDIPLAANNGWVQMGAYPEYIFKGESQRDLEVMLEFLQPVGSKSDTTSERDALALRAVFCYNRKTTGIELKEREISLKSSSPLDEKVKRRKGKKYSATLSYLEKGKKRTWRRDSVRPIKFYDFIPLLKQGEKLEDLYKSMPAREHFLALGHIVEVELRKLFYLGPLREFPRRVYVTSGQAPQDVGTKGERAVDALWFSHRSQSKRIRQIEAEVRDWFEQFGVASNISLAPLGSTNYYRVLVVDPYTGVKANLADIGFGASQTLPIIIESFLAPPDSCLLIEQPEIHLHPKAQSILGDLFIKASQEYHRAFIIETHSEHILARIRRRIAEGKIDSESVAIYYFEPSPKGSQIQRVTLNEKGQYESFPPGLFFEEDLTEAFEHLKAMKG
jgi:predicted ATPase